MAGMRKARRMSPLDLKVSRRSQKVSSLGYSFVISSQDQTKKLVLYLGMFHTTVLGMTVEAHCCIISTHILDIHN